MKTEEEKEILKRHGVSPTVLSMEERFPVYSSNTPPESYKYLKEYDFKNKGVSEVIQPLCDYCEKELNEFGGLLFSPPDENGNVKKHHVCPNCYEKLKPNRDR